MNVRALDDRAFDFRRVNFPIRAGEQQNFAAVRKKFRRAALGGLDVREFVAENAVIRLAQRCQRKRIGGSAVEDKKHLAVRLENFPETVGGALGPEVVAVADFVAGVRLGHRGPGFRTDAGIIIARKLTVSFHKNYPPRYALFTCGFWRSDAESPCSVILPVSKT